MSTEKGSTLKVEEYRARFSKHKEVFRKCMEYNFGLEDEIERIFTEDEMAKLEHSLKSLNSLEFNVFLLEVLCQRTDVKDYEIFMDILNETLQAHLANQILKDGEFTDGDTNIPLTENQRGLLRTKKGKIANQLHSLVVPVAAECKDKYINEYHYQHITKPDLTNVKKAGEMVDIMKNRSVSHFQSILQALKDNKFSGCSLLDIITDEKTTISVKVKTAAKSNNKEDLDKAEAALVVSLPGKEIEGNTVTSAQPSECIQLYLRCPTLESLEKLHESVNQKRMKELLQNLFNEILGSSETIIVTGVFADDICFMEFYQQCVLQNANLSDNMSNHALLRNGKAEMEQVFKSNVIYQSEKMKILMNAFKWRMSSGRKLFARPDREAFETLSSVCRDWRKLIQDNAFKEIVNASRKQLKEKYESITLKRLTRIQMDQEVTCIGSLLDETYIVTQESPNSIYLYDPNKVVEHSAEAILSSEQAEGVKVSEVEEQILTSAIKASKKHIVQASLEKIEIADGIEISSVESVDDQTGLFCINRTDNSVWFWTRSETRNKATAYKQFSPCTNITTSPIAKGNLRIVVLKDRNAVEMHNPSSELIQMMFLPDHVKKVNDILCNKEGLLIVSYGSNDNPLHRVSLVSRTGSKALLTYGNECGSGANELNNPSSIALDQENEILYVVDKGNERIVALDKHMDLINVVLDSKYNGTGSPVAVRFSKGSQRLLVAYKEAVEVFKVNRKLQPQQVQPQQQPQQPQQQQVMQTV